MPDNSTITQSADVDAEMEVLTPSGVGAIAIVRVRGRDAWEILRDHVHCGRGPLTDRPEPGSIQFGRFVVGREVVDDILVCAIPKFGSSEAHQVATAEISCHGGVRVVQRIVHALERAGVRRFRQSTPLPVTVKGEVEKALRQVLTFRAVRLLLAQQSLLQNALTTAVELVARGQADQAARLLEDIGSRYPSTACILEAPDVVIVGPPNAGKSSLLNALVDREVALTADQPGVTRDWVEAETAVQGVAVRFVDTAGLRVTDDRIETEAITLGLERVRDARLRLLVVDGGSGVEAVADVKRWMATLKPRPERIVVNKLDEPSARLTLEALAASHVRASGVSAVTGEGVSVLREQILADLAVPKEDENTPCAISTPLQQRLLEASRLILSGDHLGGKWLNSLLSDG